ncbi:hypothetical protein ACSBR2_027030 [Camellia fascicularis]
MVMSVLLRFIYPPPPSLFVTAMSVISAASLANAGISEIKGKHMQYSKFWNNNNNNNNNNNIGSNNSQKSPSSSSAKRAKLSTKTGMLIAYTPALLASVASFGIFPNEGFRFLLVNSALTIHFFKRFFEVLFIHKYSSVMYLDVAIPISLSYFISTSTMIYAQHLTLGFPEPPLDIKDAGISMFLMGISGNLYHHYLLSKLREQGDKGYKIPKGGLFDRVICPHYLFEILGFIGISCISQTLYAFSFTLGTTIYLMGRSYATRKWYLTNFQDFPKNIKALIPFVL